MLSAAAFIASAALSIVAHEDRFCMIERELVSCFAGEVAEEPRFMPGAKSLTGVGERSVCARLDAGGVTCSDLTNGETSLLRATTRDVYPVPGGLCAYSTDEGLVCRLDRLVGPPPSQAGFYVTGEKRRLTIQPESSAPVSFSAFQVPSQSELGAETGNDVMVCVGNHGGLCQILEESFRVRSSNAPVGTPVGYDAQHIATGSSFLCNSFAESRGGIWCYVAGATALTLDPTRRRSVSYIGMAVALSDVRNPRMIAGSVTWQPGHDRVCAVADDRVYCSERARPPVFDDGIEVPGLEGALALAVGRDTVCAIRAHDVVCHRFEDGQTYAAPVRLQQGGGRFALCRLEDGLREGADVLYRDKADLFVGLADAIADLPCSDGANTAAEQARLYAMKAAEIVSDTVNTAFWTSVFGPELHERFATELTTRHLQDAGLASFAHAPESYRVALRTVLAAARNVRTDAIDQETQAWIDGLIGQCSAALARPSGEEAALVGIATQIKTRRDVLATLATGQHAEASAILLLAIAEAHGA
jgi:hypothetical protein